MRETFAPKRCTIVLFVYVVSLAARLPAKISQHSTGLWLCLFFQTQTCRDMYGINTHICFSSFCSSVMLCNAFLMTVIWPSVLSIG